MAEQDYRGSLLHDPLRLFGFDALHVEQRQVVDDVRPPTAGCDCNPLERSPALPSPPAALGWQVRPRRLDLAADEVGPYLDALAQLASGVLVQFPVRLFDLPV